jgi:hypothetical protein
VQKPLWQKGLNVDFDTKGLFNYEYVTKQGLAIDCWIYFEEGEEATRDDPGEPETIELHHALVGGIDILEVLDMDLVTLIEEKALKEAMEAYGD